jgi:hypothetical protein
LDVRYRYDTAGVAFGKRYDKGVSTLSRKRVDRDAPPNIALTAAADQ